MLEESDGLDWEVEEGTGGRVVKGLPSIFGRYNGRVYIVLTCEIDFEAVRKDVDLSIYIGYDIV